MIDRIPDNSIRNNLKALSDKFEKAAPQIDQKTADIKAVEEHLRSLRYHHHEFTGIIHRNDLLDAKPRPPTHPKNYVCWYLSWKKIGKHFRLYAIKEEGYSNVNCKIVLDKPALELPFADRALVHDCLGDWLECFLDSLEFEIHLAEKNEGASARLNEAIKKNNEIVAERMRAVKENTAQLKVIFSPTVDEPWTEVDCPF